LSVFEFFSKEKTTAAEDDVRRALDRYRKTAIENGVTNVDIRIAEGTPGEVIVKDVIPSVKPDMVVIGSHSQKGTEKYFGSQSSYIANHAPVTVMIVR
jgi:nucleotide-binding universal stress UspA family protein